MSRRRRQAAGRFARALEELLGELAMPRTRFEVRLNEREPGPEDWSERGIDRGEFFLSANPGEDVRPLARIVSGGELSRVMLALKTLATAKNELRADFPNVVKSKNELGAHFCRTLIFDEVDAGIGGRVADVVGGRLQALGGRFQVLCITHLAQIAARATTHFRIEKTVRGSRTVTSVEPLGEAGRVDEIGRMIGGAAVSETVRTTARELLAQAKGESESPGRRKRK